VFEPPWSPFAVCSAYKSSSSLLQVSNDMTNLEKARLELTEAQLLNIKDRIKNWSTKDKIIDLMRYRYGRIEDQAA
tara:strand:+ start:503 stop:730 length:228 start_codon:yes stop_codon:yes gene_type:complete